MLLAGRCCMLNKIQDCLKQTVTADLTLQRRTVGVFMHTLALLRQWGINFKGQMTKKKKTNKQTETSVCTLKIMIFCFLEAVLHCRWTNNRHCPGQRVMRWIKHPISDDTWIHWKRTKNPYNLIPMMILWSKCEWWVHMSKRCYSNAIPKVFPTPSRVFHKTKIWFALSSRWKCKFKGSKTII